jgi:hypothetical protein
MTTLDFQFPYTSQRMPILARNAVATSQPLAAQAGLRMLLKGGNAVDAILATAISLTVLEPTSNGIGSDAFCIECFRPFTGRLDPGPFQRCAGDAATRLGFGNRTGLRCCLGGNVAKVRQAAFRRPV